MKTAKTPIYDKTKLAYSKIIETIKKYSDVCDIDISDFEYKMKNHLFGIELSEKYGLNVNPKKIYANSWNSISYHKAIGYYHGENMYLGCSDDRKQPYEEYLVNISFSTGAYIFGEQYDYMQDTFKKMWEEFKSFNPKYSDTPNHTLLFSLDNAAEPFNRFDDIIAKYREEAKQEIRIRKAKHLKEQLKELED